MTELTDKLKELVKQSPQNYLDNAKRKLLHIPEESSEEKVEEETKEENEKEKQSFIFHSLFFFLPINNLFKNFKYSGQQNNINFIYVPKGFLIKLYKDEDMKELIISLDSKKKYIYKELNTSPTCFKIKNVQY